MQKNQNYIRYLILILLCIQNASYSLLRKYSTMTEKVSSKEILLVGEIIKLFVSVGFILTDKELTNNKGFDRLYWLLIKRFVYITYNLIFFKIQL